MRQIIIQPGQTGSAASGVWEKLLDIGYLTHAIALDWAGAAVNLTDILGIQILLNGTIYWDLTGPEINDMNVRDGVPTFGASGNTFVIPLDLMGLKDPRLKELTAINTGKASPVTGKIINTFKIRITLNPAANQNFSIYMDVEPATSDGPGLVRRFNRYQKGKSNSATGTTFTEFDFGNLSWAKWRRIWTLADTGLVLSQGLKATSGNLWGELITETVANALAEANGQDALGYFSAVLDFGFALSGYTPVPKIAPADPKNPQANPTVQLDSGSDPYLNTLPFNGQTLTLTTVNDTAGGNNNFILEGMGNID